MRRVDLMLPRALIWERMAPSHTGVTEYSFWSEVYKFAVKSLTKYQVFIRRKIKTLQFKPAGMTNG